MHPGKFELPDAGLYLQDCVLVRLSDNGVMTGRYPVEDVAEVHADKVTDWVAIVTGLVFLTLAVVAKIYVTSSAWSWIVAIALAFIAAMLFLVAKDTRLHLSTKDGPVTFRLSGDEEDVEAFVASLKAVVRRSQDEARKSA